MKVTKSKEVSMKMRSFYTAKNELKRLIEISDELREFFLDEFPEGVTDGEYTITAKQCSRTNLNKKQLEIDFGDLSKYETETPYQKVEIIKNDIASRKKA